MMSWFTEGEVVMTEQNCGTSGLNKGHTRCEKLP